MSEKCLASKPDLKILALDLGTTCGWAHSSGVSGTWDLSVKPDESRGMRLVRLRGKLNEIKNQLGVDIVVFEAPRNLKYGNAIRVAAEFQGVLEVWAIDNNCEYKGYSPKQIKKFATGNGNANKEDMIKAAKGKWPKLKIKDDNHADALWLLELAKHEILGV